MNTLRSLLFLLLVFVILGVVSLIFPQPELSVGSVTLRFPSLAELMQTDSTAHPVALADTLIHEVHKPTHADTLAMERAERLRYYQQFFATDTARIAMPDDDPLYLADFFDALDSAQTQMVHVMHYGDSQIEGDRITGYLREQLQRRFSGSGPGLLPLSQPVSGRAVAQSSTDSIGMYYGGGIMGRRSPVNRYGAMVQYADLHDVDLSVTVSARAAKNFARVTIFAGNVDGGLTIGVNGSESELGDGEEMQQRTWNFQRPTNRVEVSFRGTGEVYGMAIDGGTGVSVSNLPLRGSDGLFFTRVRKASFAQMLKALNTRLVIMEFGGNALPVINDSAAVRRYCTGFAKQIDYVHSACPAAKILVIGPADMSVKKNGRLQSHAMLPYLVEHMRESVNEHGAAFWNMYEVMGGWNSMISWVEHKPRWAAPDYIHFSHKGVERIAEVLWQTLTVYYDYYHFRKEDEQ